MSITLPMLDDVVAVGHRRSEAEVLFHQQDGEALLAKHADGIADLLHDDGRQALGRLVEQQQLGARAQDAGDRQHLLLAARQLGALAGAALLQVGKQSVDLVDRQARRPCTFGGSIRFSRTLRLAKMPRSSGQ